MAAVYYLCSKEVETKKGDRLVCFLLCRDGFGNPAIRSFWLDSEGGISDSVRDLVPGCAVRAQTDFGNDRALSFIEENPEPPILDLTAFLDTGL